MHDGDEHPSGSGQPGETPPAHGGAAGKLGAMSRPHLTNDAVHAEDCHRRWVIARNRRTEDPAYQDSWFAEQCGACRYWISLTGVLVSDYVACTSALSDFDKHVMFEHDGCSAFDPADSFGG